MPLSAEEESNYDQIFKNLYCVVSAISENQFSKPQLQSWKDADYMVVRIEMTRSA